MLRQKQTGGILQVSNVYKPSEDGDKTKFFDELRSMGALVTEPWILAGDFHVVRWLTDRSGDMRGITTMCQFNEVIMDLQLIGVPLRNIMFTWSSKRPLPVFSKIDVHFTIMVSPISNYNVTNNGNNSLGPCSLTFGMQTETNHPHTIQNGELLVPIPATETHGSTNVKGRGQQGSTGF